MRKIILYIAVSLDGFLADTRGGVGWLEDCGDAGDSYASFLREVDAVVMGWRTYHQVAAELSPGQWPYAGLDAYVITHRTAASSQGIRFVQEDPCALIRRLRKLPGKAIWICGGADIAQALLREDLIDRLHLTFIPILLGDGLRLFGRRETEQKLRLISVKETGGAAELVYERRNPAD